MLGHGVQQALDGLAVQKVGQVALEHFRQMCGDDRGRIHHRIPRQHGFLALAVRNPEGGQVESGLAGFDAVDLGGHVAGVHGQEVVHQDFRRSHLIALDQQGVLAGLQL